LACLLNHLEAHGYRTTRVIKNKNDNFVIDYNGRPVYLKEFLPGRIVSKPDLSLINDVGIAIAKLHEVPIPDGLPDSFPYGMKYFHEVINLKFSHPFQNWLKQKLSYLQDQILPEIPHGLVHGDVFGDNIIQKDGSLIAIIDFEEVSKSPFVFDIGMAIVGIFADNKNIELEKAKALVSGYQSVRSLTTLEKAQLKLFCIYGAVATAFWRFRQYHIRYPIPEKFNRHEQMVEIADTLIKMDNHEFVEKIFP
ncbi:MAG: phosphotransferase, partial [Candidatus Kariarchaeaceae archaeon]